jgi:hypothetical protein
MKLVRVVLANSVRWNIKPTDPKTVLLPFLDGARLLNPLVSVEPWTRPLAICLRDGTYHVETDGIALMTPDDLTVEDLATRLSSTIRFLRATSRQASLMDKVVAIVESDAKRLPKLALPTPDNRRGTLYGAYRIRTALTLAHFRLVPRSNNAAEFPLYDEILLDSLRAYESSDYRQAVLYAAIAVESLASSYLEEKYSALLMRKRPPSHLNIASYALPKGETTRIDPVYSVLMKSENFARLLHETPLYLMRRSMRNEDQALYQSCLRLYGQRNRLGHGRALKPEDFVLDSHGSLNAIQVAIRAFAWFGRQGFHAPTREPVSFG